METGLVVLYGVNSFASTLANCMFPPSVILPSLLYVSDVWAVAEWMEWSGSGVWKVVGAWKGLGSLERVIGDLANAGIDGCAADEFKNDPRNPSAKTVKSNEKH